MHLVAEENFLLVYYGSDGSGGWQRLDRPLRTITTVDRFALVEHGEGGPTIRMLQVPELKRPWGSGWISSYPKALVETRYVARQRRLPTRDGERRPSLSHGSEPLRLIARAFSSMMTRSAKTTKFATKGFFDEGVKNPWHFVSE